MPNNCKGEVELFTEAIKLSTEERISFLDRACDGNQDLRRSIEKLLRDHDRAGEFMEEPLPGSINELRTKISAGEKPGDRIGRYKLLQQIGAGGCGIVFVAEQQEPVRRRVALKVITPGMDTRSVIARFEVERQALALMDHPSITRVFDAGATESGRPYFVMELVDGVRITDYCDQHALPTSHRLELFVQVCLAIQHAHQKGIVHRDIKPSNILVTAGPDGKPVPKVIDFGIAKAIGGQRLTEKTIITAAELVIGTPAYMSPEQAALQITDVDTRTDIYSLGVLLYELLTGTTPFDTRELLKAGLDELRRVIREQEPVRPSTRLSTMVAAARANFATHHGAEAPGLIREMRGELDWIVMKALEKDRARRYATANGLAMDVKRYRSGRAIEARSPSAAYKFRKLVARNKIAFSGVALVFIFLVASLITTTRWLISERGAREQLRLQKEISTVDEQGYELFFRCRFSEAEAMLVHGLGLRRQLSKGELATPLFNQVILLQSFVTEKRYDKIKPFFDEFVDESVLTKPGYLPPLESAIDYLIQDHRWDEADSLAARLHRAAPDDSNLYHMLVPMRIERNDIEGYRVLCREIVSRFSNTTDPSVADKMAKDCLVLPSSGVDLKLVAAMADVAVTRGSNSGAFLHFQCCKALAELRQGHYEQATNWASIAARSDYPYLKADSSAIKAISFFKLSRPDDARAALNDCDRVMDASVPRFPNELGDDWRDWIIAHALQSEAKQMIDGELLPQRAQ